MNAYPYFAVPVPLPRILTVAHLQYHYYCYAFSDNKNIESFGEEVKAVIDGHTKASHYYLADTKSWNMDIITTYVSSWIVNML